ncbi:unnamed protein product [Callosobruchus maculatus]|uniref:Uncharacterized protein n=1 Tax=Callosobruchus maculatus TaxID=64391 RepID=A0A653DLD9_CALMS|nr:unnamed protein product [Callosobruchus maculatus]
MLFVPYNVPTAAALAPPIPPQATMQTACTANKVGTSFTQFIFMHIYIISYCKSK